MNEPRFPPTLIRRPDLRKYALFLDAVVVIPGTRIGVGMASIVGLVPGLGDALAAMLSAYIVLEAAKEGVSVLVLARMLLNIAIDSILGVVPVFGDIFDIVWHADIRNIDLLERSTSVVSPGGHNRRRLFWVTVGIAGSLLMAIIAIIAFALWLLVRLIEFV